MIREQTTTQVQNLIADIINRRILEAEAIHPAYAELWRRVLAISLHGGKRTRPYLTMLGYGQFDDKVVPIAAAQELLHIAMLMHDDIIDQDSIRHGVKNITGLYVDSYGEHAAEQATHFANSAALLAGDALISEAYQCIAASDVSLETAKMLHKRLGQSIFEVIGGELMDVEAGFVKDTDYDPFDIYYYKTASYSFVGPLVTGALSAGADKETINLFKRYGTEAGIAFQLQDDILGLYGDPEVTGKSVLTDLREGKATHLIDIHKQHYTPEMKARFDVLFGNQDVADEEIAILKQDIIDSGARQAVEDRIGERYRLALNELNHLTNEPQRAELRAFTEKLMGRTL